MTGISTFFAAGWLAGFLAGLLLTSNKHDTYINYEDGRGKCPGKQGKINHLQAEFLVSMDIEEWKGGKEAGIGGHVGGI